MAKANATSRQSRPYVMAVVLGTALSALGSSTAAPAAERTVADISRYCSVCWRNARLSPDVWPDCTQEVFARLLQRLQPDGWGRVLQPDGEERREFLRAIDAVKKRTQRSRKLSSVGLEVAADRGETRERRLREEREAVRHAADRALTERQRHIVEQSLDGWSVKEIAAGMGTSVERVSDEKYKAIRKLQAYFGA